MGPLRGVSARCHFLAAQTLAHADVSQEAESGQQRLLVQGIGGMGIVRGSIVIGAVTAVAFLKIPALAEKSSEPAEPQEVVPAKVAAKLEAPLKKASVNVSGKKKQPLFRHSTYPEAWTASQDSNRPILLYVSMSGCPHCDKMIAESYHAPEMKQMISESFEPVYVTRKAHPKLVKSLKIKWYPTTVLVGRNNKIMDVIEGYVDKKTFERRLQTSLAAGKPSVQTR